jgi:DNA cross-link repair 1A protein
VLDEERYNENGSAVKKRKVEPEQPADGELAATTPAPTKSRQVSGPFIDESDSEEDLAAFGDFNDESVVPAKVESEEKDATSVRKDNDRTSEVAVPSLVREVTSHIEDSEFADFDDLEEDEFGGEQDILDQPGEDDEGAEEAVFGFDDSNDPTDIDGCDVDPGGGATVCPICQVQLIGLNEAVRRSFAPKVDEYIANTVSGCVGACQ